MKYVWYLDTPCDIITCRTLDDAIETAEKHIKQNYPDKFERLVKSLYDQIDKNMDLEEFHVIDYERKYPFTVVTIDKGIFPEDMEICVMLKHLSELRILQNKLQMIYMTTCTIT